MAKQKKDDVIPPGVTNRELFERLASDIDQEMTDVEKNAVKILCDSGWSVLLNPRVESSTTEQGEQSSQAEGLYAIGLAKGRIRR